MDVQSSNKSYKFRFAQQKIVKRYSSRVLIIEGDSLIRNVLKLTFQSIGYTTHIAKCREEGMQLFRKYMPCLDLVILDIHMQGVSGNNVYSAIKRIKSNQKIVAISNDVDYKELKDIVADNDTMFVKKPFSLDAIVATCESLINT